MEIIAHRGLWFKKEEKNTLPALFKGLNEGYGLETDVRDLNGELVISHDMPILQTAISLEQLLCYYKDNGCTSTLAINIKADGLQEKLLHQLEKHHIKNYFVFDMSIPDTLGYLKHNMPVFIRISDLECKQELMPHVQGIWLDELITPWVNAMTIVEQAVQSAFLCIVSGELHGREYLSQWNAIKQAIQLGCPLEKLMLCTDMPHEAEQFFKN